MRALKALVVTGTATSELATALADGKGTLGEVAGVVKDTAAAAASTFGVSSRTIYVGDEDLGLLAAKAGDRVTEVVGSALHDGTITVSEVIELTGAVVEAVLDVTGLSDKVVIEA